MGIRGELQEPEIRVIGVNFDQLYMRPAMP